MLPIVVLSLALIFFLMKISGVMDDLAAGRRRAPRAPAEKHEGAPVESKPEVDPDRLRVFRDFIDRLSPPDDKPRGDGE